MLIEFKIKNYRSIYKEQVISLVASSEKSKPRNGIVNVGKYDLLTVLGIYGPNSSGKSNLLKGLTVMSSLVNYSAQYNSTQSIQFDPNLLIDGAADESTTFEVTFLVENTRYRYGFRYNREAFLEEWLFRKRIGREVDLFIREGDTIEVSSGLEGSTALINAAIEATRSNALLLSVGDTLNVKELKQLYRWFHHFISVDGLDTMVLGEKTKKLMINDSEWVKVINTYLQKMDLGFSQIRLSDDGDGEIPDVETVHSVYKTDGKMIVGKAIAWSLEDRESAGTKKAFHLIGPILHSLINGTLLVVDEIEAKMHTKLTTQIVSLFLRPESNPHAAQLIFATHDTNLLKYAGLRRDQINFVEKNALEVTEIYALSDFKYFDGNKERPDVDKEKRYLEGRYGATPNIQLDRLNLVENG